MANLVLYSININGISTKFDSFLEILRRLSPDIVSVCELKTSQLSSLSVKLKEENYEIVPQRKSGIAIIAKQKLEIKNVTACKHDNILSARFSYHNVPVRLIAVHGLQVSNAAATERENVFEELNIEIEHCIINEENPIISGDLNAKIENIDGTLVANSSNGKLLLEIMDKFNLKVLNFEKVCSGKWTRTITKKGETEKSVLDYIITNETLQSKLSSVQIDENKDITPFRVCQNKETFSDHNAMIATFTWKRSKKSNNDEQPTSKLGWKINSEGLTMFQEMTTDQHFPRPQNYKELESILDDTMDQCFKKKRAIKSKDTIRNNSNYWPTVKALKPYLKKGRIERKVAFETIQKLKNELIKVVKQAKADRVRETLHQIQRENGDFSPEKFWKLKKAISPRSEERTSIINENNIELFDQRNILEEYMNI